MVKRKDRARFLLKSANHNVRQKTSVYSLQCKFFVQQNLLNKIYEAHSACSNKRNDFVAPPNQQPRSEWFPRVRWVGVTPIAPFDIVVVGVPVRQDLCPKTIA